MYKLSLSFVLALVIIFLFSITSYASQVAPSPYCKITADVLHIEKSGSSGFNTLPNPIDFYSVELLTKSVTLLDSNGASILCENQYQINSRIMTVLLFEHYENWLKVGQSITGTLHYGGDEFLNGFFLSNISTTLTNKVQIKPQVINIKVEAMNTVQGRSSVDIKTNLQDKRESLRADIQNKSLDAQKNLSDKRAELADKRLEAKEKRDEKKVERKAKLAEKAKDRIKAYVERITKRLDAALDRMAKMTDRVESRIAKLEDKFTDRGLDLSESTILLEEARSEIASARADVNAIEGAIAGVLNTENPKESFSAVRALIKSATESVKSSHRALVEAVKEVKSSIGSDNNKQSSDDDEAETDEAE